VIRGGAGVFYDRTGPRPIQDLIRYNGEQQLKYVITNPGFPNPYPPGGLAAQPPSVVQLDPNVGLPLTLQYSVSLERQPREGDECEPHVHRHARLRSVPVARREVSSKFRTWPIPGVA
jgi:hypothetical protein